MTHLLVKKQAPAVPPAAGENDTDTGDHLSVSVNEHRAERHFKASWIQEFSWLRLICSSCLRFKCCMIFLLCLLMTSTAFMAAMQWWRW
ncbi:uncharacterized protein LOC132839059 isoform X1 [Tachysurus vachellii]|uniref:uncharacterized protein LOC132839059 isoform X1 n=1 Tax=Tachysurus vachellii TaxID=175792 RepID=UPI00296AE660|nr:uncharacterized protein LOC132839059 isoform X1 [Tachysurus vachellii]